MAGSPSIMKRSASLGCTSDSNQSSILWDCGTLPEYPGRRLYPALLAQMLGELQPAGSAHIDQHGRGQPPSQSGVALVGCQAIVDIIRDYDGEFMSRGRPGVSPQDVQDAYYALFGNLDRSRIG